MKLEMRGNEVHAVLNGQLGKKRLRSNYDIDIVIIDYENKETNALVFLKWICRHPRMCQIPVIVAGDSFEETTLARFVDLGVADIIILPVQADTLEAKLTRAELGGKRTVLVVDDEPVVIELLQEFLEIERFKVVTAETAEEALEVLRKKRIDAVVVDILLPGMRGTDLLALAKIEFPGIPIILITGFSGGVTPSDAINMGADGYFAKPFHNRDLAFTLRQALHQFEPTPPKTPTTS